MRINKGKSGNKSEMRPFRFKPKKNVLIISINHEVFYREHVLLMQRYVYTLPATILTLHLIICFVTCSNSIQAADKAFVRSVEVL